MAKGRGSASGNRSHGRMQFQKWGKALRMYNQGKKFKIPKKGTKEYAAVKRIMARL